MLRWSESTRSHQTKAPDLVSGAFVWWERGVPSGRSLNCRRSFPILLSLVQFDISRFARNYGPESTRAIRVALSEMLALRLDAKKLFSIILGVGIACIDNVEGVRFC